MSKEELIKVKNDIIKLNKELSKYKEEISELEKTDIIKRYLWLKSNIGRVDKEIEDKTKEEKKIRYELCDHDVLYLMHYAVRRKKYNPKFICLSCGKKILGTVSTRQVIINNDYLDYDNANDVYIGTELECEELSSKCNELKGQGCPTDYVVLELTSILNRKYNGKRLSVNLLKKQKEFN